MILAVRKLCFIFFINGRPYVNDNFFFAFQINQNEHFFQIHSRSMSDSLDI